MSSLRSLFSALIAALLFLASTGCDGPSGSDGSPPGFGAWLMSESIGEITHTESGGFCSGSWVFSAKAESDSNLVRVIGSAGDIEFTVAFEGVEGSPFPSGFETGGSGVGSGGEIFGHVVNEEHGAESTMSGTYDDTTMEATWTMTQHVEGAPGGCTVDRSGGGSFTAVRR